MNKGELVSKIMSTDVITIDFTNSLLDAERLFKKNKIRHIPVVNNHKIVGMLSMTDLLRIGFADSFKEEGDIVETPIYEMLSIEQVMVKDPVHISVDKTIKEVAEVLSNHEFHALPVVDNGELVGIVTTTDLLNYLLAQY